MFNPEKLDWFNQQHIMRLAPDELAVRVKPWLVAAGLWRDDVPRRSPRVVLRRARAAAAARQAARRFRDAGRVLFRRCDRVRRRPRSKSICARRAVDAHLERSTPHFAALDTFDAAVDEAALRCARRGARREGRCAHTCRTCGGDGKSGKSRVCSTSSHCWGGIACTARLTAARRLLLTSRS